MALNRQQRLLLLMLLKRMQRRKRCYYTRRSMNNLLFLSEEVNNMMQIGFSHLFALLPNPRSCCSYIREETWFTELWANRFDEHYQGGKRWVEDFRMSADTFIKLVEMLRPYLQKEDTVSPYLGRVKVVLGYVVSCQCDIT